MPQSPSKQAPWDLTQFSQSPSAAHSCDLLNLPNSFQGGTFKLNAKFDAGSLLCSLSHFECDGHTVQILTQLHLPPPLTSTAKSSLFTHEHSSPLTLAARLHGCCTNRSHYINNGWTFSGQTPYFYNEIFYVCVNEEEESVEGGTEREIENICFHCRFLYPRVSSQNFRKLVVRG